MVWLGKSSETVLHPIKSICRRRHLLSLSRPQLSSFVFRDYCMTYLAIHIICISLKLIELHHKRTVWGVQRGRRWLQAVRHPPPPPCRRTTLLGYFRGGSPAGRRRVGYGGPGYNFRESMANHCHTPMIFLQEIQYFSLTRTKAAPWSELCSFVKMSDGE
jgi:hypothetical protein